MKVKPETINEKLHIFPQIFTLNQIKYYQMKE